MSTPKIVILTGAGISAESGLGTFRDEDGLWTKYDLTEVATPEGFARNPGLVIDFYNARRANCMAAEPNPAHQAVARLESALTGQVVVVTQNVDDLHQRAGSSSVLQMHGALNRALCSECGYRWDAPEVMEVDDPCPTCAAPRTRPDVVWFGGNPHHMETIDMALGGCRLFAAIGTSGSVWPAAGFAQIARRHGAHCVELNLEPSEISQVFHERRYGPATQIVPDWVETVIAKYM